MQCDLDEEVKQVSYLFPCISALVGGSSIQYFIVIEQCVLGDCEFIDALTPLISAYFTLNIE